MKLCPAFFLGFVDTPSGLLEVGSCDNTVAIQHFAGLVVGEFHGDLLRRPRMDKMPNRATPEGSRANSYMTGANVSVDRRSNFT